MPRYEINLLGRSFEVEAANQNAALGMARMHVARQGMTEQATAGAQRRSNVPAPNKVLDFMGRLSGVGSDEDRQQLLATREAEREGAVRGGAVALPTLALAPLVGGFIAAPAATAAAVGTGIVGGEVGGRAGGAVGGAAESLGAPKGTAAVLRGAGTLAGGLAGGMGATKAVEAVRGAVAGPLERAVAGVLTRQAPVAAAEAAAVAEVPAVAALQRIGAVARQEAIASGATSAQAHEAALGAVQKAIRGGMAAEAPAVLPAGSRAMPTNLGGAARPGPPPTPPDQIESALKASLAKAEGSVLQAPRVEVGAQRVGRDMGMTKEEVRKLAGPVLDEALGEASPILPRKAFQSIIDTMKAMPMSEREAYVARATSGKAKWQIENVRRTLEHLGLLLPAGVAVGAMAEQGRK